MQRGKFILVGVSGILVVGVVIGLISGVNKNDNKSSSQNSGGGGDTLSATSKSVAAICAPTDYKEACVNSLSTVANNKSATPTDLVQAAIQYTVEEVKKALANTSAVENAVGKDDSFNKMAVDDCKELLQYALDELQASFSMVGDPNMHTASDREAELNNWLSAVISYQETCLDGFNSTDLRKSMSDMLSNASKLSENALSIVSAMNDILKAFNIPVNITTTSTNTNSSSSRRLLEVDEDGYPTWMPENDRKLMQHNHNHNHNNNKFKPNAVVAKDGSGQFKTIGAALAAYPKTLPPGGRYSIYVKAGVYDEYITVDKKQVNVFMYGDGPGRTIVTGKKSNTAGFTTFKTASFSAIGNGFIAKEMAFQNTAGPEGHQAVALRIMSDRAAFYNCRMDGYQDTLYAQQHRHFFRNCVITGTVDFIFGMGSTVIQNCGIEIRKPMKGQQNTVTAHGRKTSKEATGIVIQNCRITAEPQPNPTYLGRPWKAYSRAVIMESDLGNVIHPAGWLPWQGNFGLDTCYFAEYGNGGPSADTHKRVNWKGFHAIKNKNEVLPFTAGSFIQGSQWIPATGAPFMLGMAH